MAARTRRSLKILFAWILVATAFQSGPTLALAPGAPVSVVAMAARLPEPWTPMAARALPGAIDSTGVRDVTDALQSFIDRAPQGTSIVFRHGGLYRVTGLRLDGKRNLVLEGNGATLRLVGFDRAAIGVISSDGIVIRNLTIVGDNTDAGGPNAYHPGKQEFAHGIAIRGSHDIEVGPAVTITSVWGDGVFVGSWTNFADWSESVYVHDSRIQLTGRNGLVVNAGRNVMVVRNAIDKVAIDVFDLEPDDPAEGATRVEFLDNSIGSYGLTSLYASFLLASVGNRSATVADITLSRNSVTGNVAGYAGTRLCLQTYVSGGDVRRSNIVVTDNVCSQVAGPAWTGAVMYFNAIDGLKVSGNVQALSGGPLLRVTDSTSVVDQ